MPRRMLDANEREFAELAGFLRFFSTHVLGINEDDPVHPSNALECGVSLFGKSKALAGLRQAIHDDIEMSQHQTPFTQKAKRRALRHMFSVKFLKRSKMRKPRRNIGLEILEGLREINRGEYGRVVTIPTVTSIREKTGLSQARFAQLLGVSVRTLQDWEQGRRSPSGAARTLLMIAQKNPRALLEVA